MIAIGGTSTWGIHRTYAKSQIDLLSLRAIGGKNHCSAGKGEHEGNS